MQCHDFVKAASNFISNLCESQPSHICKLEQLLGTFLLLSHAEEMRVWIWMQRYLADSPFNHRNAYSMGDPNLNQENLREQWRFWVPNKRGSDRDTPNPRSWEDCTCSVIVNQLSREKEKEKVASASFHDANIPTIANSYWQFNNQFAKFVNI